MYKDHITPWDNHNQSYSVILEHQLDPEKQQQSQKQQIHLPSLCMPKLQKKYQGVLPKVYQKHKSTSDLNTYKKIQRSKLACITPTPLSRNEIIMSIPNISAPIPKQSKDQRLKHSNNYHKKHLILRTDSQQKQQQQRQLQLLKKKLRKNSDEIKEKEMIKKIYSKIKKYDEDIIKKCSLKNLQIYEHLPSNDINLKGKEVFNKKIQESSTEKLEKKHILDRILTRLE